MTNFKFLYTLVLLFITIGSTMPAQSNKKKPTAEKKEKGVVVSLTKADFLKKVFDYENNTDKWVYAGEKPCIIDFYATWCGPCKKIAPILEELADEYKDDIVIYKIDVDKEKELAKTFGIQAMPTILFIPKEGQPVMSMGALPKEEFVKQINRVLLINTKQNEVALSEVYP